MKTKNIIKQIVSLEEYSIHYVIAKQFIMEGVKTEEELQNILKTEPKITRPMRWSIQNAFRDIMISKIVNIDDIQAFL